MTDAWKPPWEAWAEAVEQRREAERSGADVAPAASTIALYRTESAFLVSFLLSVALAEDGIRQKVYETLTAFKIQDAGARGWLRDMQNRVDGLAEEITGLKDENQSLRDRLSRLEPPDMTGE